MKGTSVRECKHFTDLPKILTRFIEYVYIKEAMGRAQKLLQLISGLDTSPYQPASLKFIEFTPNLC